MMEEKKMPAEANVVIQVSPGPHAHNSAQTTHRMMLDVLIALIPAVLAGFLVFGGLAIKQIMICLLSALAAEYIFNRMRNKPFSLMDGSAAITGVILALSLPVSAPWYVGVIGYL